MALLRVTGPSGTTRQIVLEDGAYLLGRDPAADVPLPDQKASRQHARIVAEGHVHTIEDLESANGVLLNGKPLLQPMRLKSGAVIEIGDHMLTYESSQDVPPSVWALVGSGGLYDGQVLVLPEGEAIVGRDGSCDVTLADASVSRQHAIIQVGASTLSVKDLNSSNGTFVNRKPVTARSVSPGEHIRFGNLDFVLQDTTGRRRPGGVRGWTGGDPVRTYAGMGLVLGALVVLVTLTAMQKFPQLRATVDGWMGGPSQEERLHVASFHQHLGAARKAMQERRWNDAAANYTKALEKDPLHDAARVGLRVADENIRHQVRLDAADKAITEGDARKALTHLYAIRPEATLSVAAAKRLKQAQTMLADKSLVTARDACRERQWRICHAAVTDHLEVRPGTPEARALLAQAEGKMRARGMAVVPWVSPDEAVRQEESARLAARYPDPRVRDVVLRYAGGQVADATRRARGIGGRRGGRPVGKALAAQQKARSQLSAAEKTGNVEQMRAARDALLELDAQLVPTNVRSAVRSEIRTAQAQSYLQAGQAAFDRGLYHDAFVLWRQGLRYDRKHAGLNEGLEQLAKRAAGLLKAAGGNEGKEACARYREVLEMTAPESGLHLEARQLLAAKCGRR